MEQLYEELFADFAPNVASAPSVVVAAPSNGRKMIYLDDVPAPRRAEQTLIDYVETLPHTVAMRLLYTSFADDHVYVPASLQPLMGDFFSEILVGKTVKTVKRAINKLTGSFGATLKTGESNKLVMGFYELDDRCALVAREDPPPFVSSVVTGPDAQLARVVATLAKIKVSLSATDGDASSIVNEAVLVPANDLHYPMEPKWLPLIAPLVAVTKTKPIPVWELYQSYLSTRASAVGMSIPYWSYRVNEHSWVRKYPGVPPPDLKTCLDALTLPPWDRASINGFMRNSVWFDGKLLPAHIALWNALWLLEIKSVVGNYPQKVVACSIGCDFYGLAAAVPDPNSGSHFYPTSAEAWTKVKADCYWNPSADIAGVIKSSTIVLSANSYSQVAPVASVWMEAGEKYAAVIVYGPNPHLFLTKHPDGLPKAAALQVMRIMLNSVLWMPFFNLSHFVHNVNSLDVWALSYISGWNVLRVDSIKGYCYVPRVLASRIDPTFTSASIAEFSTEVTEVSANFHFFGENMTDVSVSEPAVKPPAKKRQRTSLDDEDTVLSDASVEENAEDASEE